MSVGSWQIVAALISAACLLWLSWDLRRQPLPRILVFVVYVIFFRFVLSAFHQFTFPSVIGPLSINALFTLSVISLGLLLVNHRLLLLKHLLPVYAIMVLVLISATVNGTLKESIQSILKWLYFIVVSLAIYEAMIRCDRAIVYEKLFKAFCVPMTLQAMAVLLHYYKYTERDESVSYVGGYNHEAVFSVMMIAAMLLAALNQFSQTRQERGWGFWPLVAAVEVMLTNYRTNILTMLIPLGGYLYFRFLRKGLPLTKVVASVGLAFILILSTQIDYGAVIDRFSDVGTVLDESFDLIKPPAYYTEWEQDYFSARVYIWSQYIDAYVNGTSLQHLIGLGPDSWEARFPKYAHNTFVSYLYELGIFGCGLLIYLMLRHIGKCFHGPLTVYSSFLFLSFLGFLIMNLGTMPMWQIEGITLFAVLCAATWNLELEASSLHGHLNQARPAPLEGPRLAPQIHAVDAESGQHAMR